MHEAKSAEQAQEIAEVLGKSVLRFEVKSGPTGSLFGSVTPSDIVDEIWRTRKVRVDRRKVETDPIKRIGRFTIPIELFDDVRVEVKTLVVPEGGELPPEEELEAIEAAEAAEAEAAEAQAAAEHEEAEEAIAEVIAEEEPEPEVEEEPRPRWSGPRSRRPRRRPRRRPCRRSRSPRASPRLPPTTTRPPPSARPQTVHRPVPQVCGTRSKTSRSQRVIPVGKPRASCRQGRPGPGITYEHMFLSPCKRGAVATPDAGFVARAEIGLTPAPWPDRMTPRELDARSCLRRTSRPRSRCSARCSCRRPRSAP